jgi:hypothetical protein
VARDWTPIYTWSNDHLSLFILAWDQLTLYRLGHASLLLNPSTYWLPNPHSSRIPPFPNDLHIMNPFQIIVVHCLDHVVMRAVGWFITKATSPIHWAWSRPTTTWFRVLHKSAARWFPIPTIHFYNSFYRFTVTDRRPEPHESDYRPFHVSAVVNGQLYMNSEAVQGVTPTWYARAYDNASPISLSDDFTGKLARTERRSRRLKHCTVTNSVPTRKRLSCLS